MIAEFFYLPFVLMMAFPGAALVPGVLLLALFLRRRQAVTGQRRRLAGVAVAAWLAYGIYETGMYFWMQTVIAPIRVDLLFIAPVLYLLAVGALLALLTAGPASEEEHERAGE